MKKQIVVAAVIGLGLGSLVLVVALVLMRDRPGPAPAPLPEPTPPVANVSPETLPGPAPAPIQAGNVKGDFAFAAAMAKLDLSEDQQRALAPIREAAERERESLLAAYRATNSLLAQQLKSSRDLAKQPGIRSSSGVPEVAPLREQMQKAQQNFEGQLAAWREKTMARMLPLLREEQGRKFKLWTQRMVLLHGPGGGLPAQGYPNDGFVPNLDEEFLLQMAPGVDLTEPQHQQAIAALKPLVEQYKAGIPKHSNLVALLPEPLRQDFQSAEARQALAELAKERDAAAEPFVAAMRQAVGQVLTPEQRAAVEAKRR